MLCRHKTPLECFFWDGTPEATEQAQLFVIKHAGLLLRTDRWSNLTLRTEDSYIELSESGYIICEDETVRSMSKEHFEEMYEIVG